MSRVFVTDDAVNVFLEIHQDPEDGYASARCLTGDWATDPRRFDSLEDVINEASIHLDLEHPGGV